jgi:hypothetical protein
VKTSSQNQANVRYPLASWELKCVERVILCYATKPNMPELRASNGSASHHGERQPRGRRQRISVPFLQTRLPYTRSRASERATREVSSLLASLCRFARLNRDIWWSLQNLMLGLDLLYQPFKPSRPKLHPSRTPSPASPNHSPRPSATSAKSIRRHYVSQSPTVRMSA